MTLLRANRTAPNPEIDKLARMTHPGMAHFAGTGPAGRTCGECRYLNGQGRCEKFIELMRAARRNTSASKIFGYLLACKYFEDRPEATGHTDIVELRKENPDAERKT